MVKNSQPTPILRWIWIHLILLISARSRASLDYSFEAVWFSYVPHEILYLEGKSMHIVTQAYGPLEQKSFSFWNRCLSLLSELINHWSYTSSQLNGIIWSELLFVMLLVNSLWEFNSCCVVSLRAGSRSSNPDHIID